MSSKNKVTVRIAGRDYVLVGNESDEYIQKIGLYVDRRMNEILKENTTLSTSMAAVLVALNIADDLYKITEKDNALKADHKKALELVEALKSEKRKLTEETAAFNSRINSLSLELAKREAELKEVRNNLEHSRKTG